MAELSTADALRETVRERYAAAARATTDPDATGCCTPGAAVIAEDSADVVLSNCVINLSTDKPRVLREAARVLRPGGRFAVSDVIADAAMDEATRADLAQYVGCVAGALTEYTRYLADAGLTDIEIQETHRVHEHAASAIVRARKPVA